MSNMNDIDENILYGNFIRYEVLKNLTMQSLSYSNSNELNVFIDMYSLLEPLYRGNVTIHNYTGICSSIINLCAHIRGYYRSAHRVETKFFLINSRNVPLSARQFYGEYNFQAESTTIDSRQITKTIADNCNILSVLCPYLPDIFYIEDNNTETSVIIQNLADKFRTTRPDVPNVVISKDPYTYQLAAMNMNIVIFRPKKSNGIDESWVVTHSNVYEMYIKHETKISSEINYSFLVPELFSFVMSLSGFPCRKLYSAFNINSAFKILEKAIASSKMNNSYTSDVEYTLSMMEYNRTKAPEYYIANRFKAIDLVFQSYIYSNCPSMQTNTSTIVNLYDPDEVRNINNKYFVSNPLDLNKL